MITVYIKEWEKEKIESLTKIPKGMRKPIEMVIKRWNLVLVKEAGDNKKIYLIPDVKKQNICGRISKKLEKESTRTQRVQVVLAKNIKSYQQELKEYHIVDGKQTFYLAIESILNKILQENPLALQDVYLLTKYYKEQNINLIKQLAPKVKNMNIITKEIESYRILEKMMQEKGIMICVANNKKKSLKRANIIINLDLSKDELSKYVIARNSILIQIPEEKITNLTGFEGMILQDIRLEIEKEQMQWLEENELDKGFRNIELYESMQTIKKENKIKVLALYGNHGEISEKEMGNQQKLLTNKKN